MGFKNYATLQGYQVAEIKNMFDEDAIEPAVRLTAIHLARVMRNNMRGARRNPPPVRPGQWTGETLGDIKAMKGKYDDTTWLYGVFGPYDSSNWEASSGASAQFFEYGRSAKGKGRNRAKGRRKPQAIKNRPQPPRPFMRQTIALGKRKLFGATSKEITTLTNRIKKGKIPNKVVRQILS